MGADYSQTVFRGAGMKRGFKQYEPTPQEIEAEKARIRQENTAKLGALVDPRDQQNDSNGKDDRMAATPPI